MICPNCKKENKEGSRFCVNCGADLEKMPVINQNSVNVANKPAKKGDHKILALLSYLFISLSFLFIAGGAVFNILSRVDNAFRYSYLNTYGGFMFAASLLVIAGIILQIIYSFIEKGNGKNYGIFSFVLEALTLFFFLLTCFWSNDTQVLYASLFWIFFIIAFLCLVAAFIISIRGFKENYKKTEK
jgi:hypothetical protein